MASSNKKFIISYFLIMLLSLLTASNSAANTSAKTILIDAQWLVEHKNDKHLTIVDARPNREYLKGHIPGSVSIPVDNTFGLGRHKSNVANLQQIKKLFSNAGIQFKNTIIIYADSEYKDAGRLLWVFEVFGHKQVKLLNGGIDSWIAISHQPISKTPTKVLPTEFVPMINPERLISQFSMYLAIQDKEKYIIDVRTPDEYSGSRSTSIRHGHIPRAVNIPIEENFVMVDGIKMLRPINELKQLYSHTANKKVYTYCNKGKDSALTYTIMRQLGYDVAVYDGSWHEWSNNAELPIIEPQKKRNN